MIHLMNDIETLDNGSNAVIIAVGSVIFNNVSIQDEKEWHLDVDQQVTQGRRVSWDTIKWWMSQTEKAKTIFGVNHRSSIGFFSGEYCNFVNKYGPDILVWGNGSSFDTVILESLLKRNLPSGTGIPWKFWNHRDYRTIKSITNCHKLTKHEGEAHGALVDARKQAKDLIELWKKQPELER